MIRKARQGEGNGGVLQYCGDVEPPKYGEDTNSALNTTQLHIHDEEVIKFNGCRPEASKDRCSNFSFL